MVTMRHGHILKLTRLLVLEYHQNKGIGIPELEMKNLFQPFFRASNAFAFSGSGIGLSLVYKIVTLHNGEIKISSVLGKGTVVEINFQQN